MIVMTINREEISDDMRTCDENKLYRRLYLFGTTISYDDDDDDDELTQQEYIYMTT